MKRTYSCARVDLPIDDDEPTNARIKVDAAIIRKEPRGRVKHGILCKWVGRFCDLMGSE